MSYSLQKDLFGILASTILAFLALGAFRVLVAPDFALAYEHAFPLALGFYAALKRRYKFPVALLFAGILIEIPSLGFSEKEIIDNILAACFGSLIAAMIKKGW